MKEERNYIVYCHLFPNGKRYIGITKNIQDRWRTDGKGYYRQQFIYRSITKYGWDNIKHIILAKNLLISEACKLEEFFINKYNTTQRDNGYNRTLGGEANIPSEETKQLISLNHADCKGELNSFFGKQHSEKTKQKISQNHDYTLQSGMFHVHSKPVICFDTCQLFSCANAVDKYFKLFHDTANKICRLLKVYKGLHFMYYSDFYTLYKNKQFDYLLNFLKDKGFRKINRHSSATVFINPDLQELYNNFHNKYISKNYTI